MPQFERLLADLSQPQAYPHPVQSIEVVQTHISAVFLTGDHAYKLKKPLNLGFLDFSSVEKRAFYCKEELRLNRRLAPNLYLDVLPVTEMDGHARIGGEGEPIDYVLHMRQFDPEQQLDRLLERGELGVDFIDRLIPIITRFHQQAEKAPEDSDYGRPEVVFEPMQQNFDQLRELVSDASEQKRLDALEEWTQTEYRRLKPLLQERRDLGFVRECHGDMHLGNMTLFEGEIAIFDGIEFNPHFRWIDVANEIAFLIMDLESRGAVQLAHHALNAWLEATGDYDALALMRFYQLYRAMVRAKVASIRLAQPGISATERESILGEYHRYLDLAEEYARPGRPALLITHGFSGSGKTTLSGQLVDELGAIRVRSDRERKRLHGLSPEADSHSGVGTGLYEETATEKTYAHLRDLADRILRAGYLAIVDATFLKRDLRERFAALAAEREVPFLILAIDADYDTLRSRLHQRRGDISEATEAVLRNQRGQLEPLGDDEPALHLDSEHPLPPEHIASKLYGLQS